MITLTTMMVMMLMEGDECDDEGRVRPTGPPQLVCTKSGRITTCGLPTPGHEHAHQKKVWNKMQTTSNIVTLWKNLNNPSKQVAP